MRRHKIIILKQVGTTTNKDGVSVPNYQSLTDEPIWARVLDEGGREFYAGNADYELTKIKVNISFSPDVTRKMRIIFQEKVYEIVRIYRGDYRNIDLNIDAERRSNEDGFVNI